MRLQVIDGCAVESDNFIREGSRIHGKGKTTDTFSDKPEKRMCSGCDDDFYNDRNPYGVKECWAFKDAKVVNKVGYSSIHCANGPDTKMVKTLSCWHGVCK